MMSLNDVQVRVHHQISHLSICSGQTDWKTYIFASPRPRKLVLRIGLHSIPLKKSHATTQNDYMISSFDPIALVWQLDNYMCNEWSS